MEQVRPFALITGGRCDSYFAVTQASFVPIVTSEVAPWAACLVAAWIHPLISGPTVLA